MAPRKKASKQPGSRKDYTYVVNVSFDTTYTFTEDEVGQAVGGDEDDREPTEAALAKLEQEITEYLEQQYSVSKLEAWADFDSLPGVETEPPAPVAAQPSARANQPRTRKSAGRRRPR